MRKTCAPDFRKHEDITIKQVIKYDDIWRQSKSTSNDY